MRAVLTVSAVRFGRKALQVLIVGLGAVSMVLTACSSHAQSAAGDRNDDIAMAVMFSFREATQVHLLAHALGMAALNGTPKEDLVQQCDRAIDSYEGVSIPLLRKYLANVEHDPHTRQVFEQIQVLQERAIAEVKAIKAMANSSNGQAERLAFVAANRDYNEVAQAVATAMTNPPRRDADPEVPRDEGNGRGLASPNPNVFSDEQWASIANEFFKMGLMRDPKDAAKWFGTFALLKRVFVEKNIPEPTTQQLFRLAAKLGVVFGQMDSAKTEALLGQILASAARLGMEVAGREDLLKMAE